MPWTKVGEKRRILVGVRRSDLISKSKNRLGTGQSRKNFPTLYSRAVEQMTHALKYLIAGVLFAVLPSTFAYSETKKVGALEKDLNELDSKMSAKDANSRKALGKVVLKTRERIHILEQNLKVDFKTWDENLDIRMGTDSEIEEKRKTLLSNVEIWTSTIRVTGIDELKRGVGDALAVAKADGLNIKRLTKIYVLTKKVIRTADFVIPENSIFDRVDRLNLETDRRPLTQLIGILKIFQMGFVVEEFEAHARKRHQEYRLNLYKRAAVAFIKALISGKKNPQGCGLNQSNLKTARFKGKDVSLLNCKDFTVDYLRSYLDAVRTIQSADTDVLIAYTEELILEQEIIMTLASFIPYAGDSIDLVAAISGEDLAGYCLSPFERIVAGTMALIPYFGSDVLNYTLKQYPGIADGLEVTYKYLDSILEMAAEFPKDIAWAYKTMGLDLSDRLAKKWGVSVPALIKLRDMFEKALSPGLKLSDAALARIRTFQTIQEALDSHKWLSEMPESVRKKAIKKSSQRVKKILKSYQGTRASRVKASNMVPSHLDELEKLAMEKDWVIIYRSVNPDSTKLIAKNYATKGMNVKGKSADWGAHTGFIPVDQKYSKLGNPKLGANIDKDEILKFHKKVKECLAAIPPCANKVELVVGGMPVMIVETRGGGKITALYDQASGRYLDRKGVDISSQINTSKPARALEVLADKFGNSLTADYDILDYGWRGKHDTPRFKADKGYITRKQEEILEAANRRINKAGYAEEGINISHHGAERWFPFSPGALEVDEVVTILDPLDGLITVPRCNSKCMKNWCKTSRTCNPKMICGKGAFKKCIPPDPNRLLKDYMHNRRTLEYNIGPNPVWNWGHYNAVEGWSFAQYVANIKNKVSGGGELIGPRFAVSVSGRKDRVIKFLSSKMRTAITKKMINEAIPTCRKREPVSP